MTNATDNTMKWVNLLKRLKNDPKYTANMELAGYVVDNDSRAVNYYLTEMCLPITSVIEHRIMHRNIVGEFYEFISSPFNAETEVPEWHKISLYEGIDCKLSTYTSCIASRHFCKIAKKERILKNSETETFDFVDYETLLRCDKAEVPEDSPAQKRIKKAFGMLSDRDKQTLRYTVIEKRPSSESFDLIGHFINPRPKDGYTSEQIKSMWNDKRRQDAVSLLKGRALDHLEQLYFSIK